jgi:hypothetical protein
MKNLLLTLAILATLVTTTLGQSVPVYPIPSHNVALSGPARFEPSLNSIQEPTRKRVFQNVTVRGGPGTHATVHIYSLDGLNILGPYPVYAGETLTVEIDERDWGVFIQTDDEITVDVWTSAMGDLLIKRQDRKTEKG